MTMHTGFDPVTTVSGVNYRGRGWSPGLWQNIPFPVLRDNPRLGFTYFNDFVGVQTGTTTTGIGGEVALTAIAGTPTILAADLQGGGIVMTAAAATDTHGFICNPGSSGSASPSGACITLAAGRTVAFEILFKQTLQTSTLGSSFIGLATQATGMTTTGALTATDYLGFQALDSDDVKFTYLKSGATLYVDATKISDYVSTQWTRVGFLIDGLTSVTPYYNGAAQATITATTAKALPTGIMNATWQVVSGGGTGTPAMTVDWVRCAVIDEPYNSIVV